MKKAHNAAVAIHVHFRSMNGRSAAAAVVTAPRIFSVMKVM
jgi:hypothetical protein